MDITKELFKLQDIKYKEFHQRLIPNINPDTVIGVRTPMLREFAKQIKGSAEAEKFLKDLPHSYYEENNLHGFLIGQIKDYDECIEEVKKFLPYVDNWATCDSMRPKCFKKNTGYLLEEIENWLASKDTYAVRFGIEMLMTFYLDDEFNAKYLEKVALVKSEEYYINMMIAWYFATALAKQWESAVLYIEENRLSKWVHNKTIQKAVESYRITDEQKEYLKKLKTEKNA